MFQEITYMPDPVFGKPLIMWGGIFTATMFLVTAAIGYTTIKGIYRIPVKWHTRLAVASIAIGLVHAVLGMLSFL